MTIVKLYDLSKWNKIGGESGALGSLYLAREEPRPVKLCLMLTGPMVATVQHPFGEMALAVGPGYFETHFVTASSAVIEFSGDGDAYYQTDDSDIEYVEFDDEASFTGDRPQHQSNPDFERYARMMRENTERQLEMQQEHFDSQLNELRKERKPDENSAKTAAGDAAKPTVPAGAEHASGDDDDDTDAKAEADDKAV